MYPYFYTCKVTQDEGGKGGAEGRVATLSNPENPNYVEIKIQSPSEFKGPADDQGRSLYWSPEDFFVASAGQCLFTTFVAIAENSKLQYNGISITSKGKLEKLETKVVMFTTIEHDIYLTITKESDREKATRIMEKAEKHCLIANSMKTKNIINIHIDIKSE